MKSWLLPILILTFSFLLTFSPAYAETKHASAGIIFQRSSIPGLSAEVHYQSEIRNGGHHNSPLSEREGGTPLPFSPGFTGYVAVVGDPGKENGLLAYDPEPCARRKFGSWGFQLSYCTSSPAEPGKGNKKEASGLPSPEELAQVAIDRAIALAPQPDIELAPSRIGLTGLDSYFWLDEEPQTISAVASVPGLSVTAVATPVQYVWDYGDGEEVVTSGSGRPWTRHEAGDISHMYETKGRYRVGVEVIWQARWRTSGGGWNDLGYFSNSGSRPYPVRQVVARLVDSH